MSSNNPPPWLGITGISRADMKDNAQVSILQYDGNARPAELVVEQTVLNLYAGDNNGNLVLLANANATKFYGSFYNSLPQNNDAGNVNYLELNGTYSNNHVSVQNSDEITIDFNGVYNIQFSTQFLKTGGGTSEVYIWLEKNGTAVANTATQITMTGNNTKYVAGWNFVEPIGSNNYVRIAWLTSDDGINIVTPTVPAGVPAIPSNIVTVTQV